MARRKLKVQASDDSACECAADTAPEKKKKGRKTSTKKVAKKTVAGYKLLKRDENALVKQYAQLEKLFGDITEKVNQFCYDNGNKKAKATEANKSITAFMKDVRLMQKSIKNAKESLKPVYS